MTGAGAAFQLHEQALDASRAGRHAEAESLLEHAVEIAPALALLHSNLGLVRARAGHWEGAVAAYRAALERAPAHGSTLAKLGRALTALGRHDEAAGALGLAVMVQPEDPGHANAFGVSLAEAGHHLRARGEFRRAAGLDPGDAEIWRNLGQLEARMEAWAEAASAFGRAASLEPDAVTLYRLGVALGRLGRFAEARDAYRRAVEVDPSLAEAWNNLGHVSAALGEPAAALEPLQCALRLRPDYTEARYNLGVVWQGLDRIAEARGAYQLVLAAQGPHADSLNNLAGLCLSEARPELAAPLYERALEANPAHPEARWNLGLAQLATGDFARGWANYETRRAARPFRPVARWTPGAALDGRRLWLWCEQGLGDGVQFLRYLPLLAAHGPASIAVECPAPLAGLFALAPGIDEVIIRGGPVSSAGSPAFDYHAPLMSLPHLLGTRVDSIPPPGPAYAIPGHQRARWRARLDSTGVTNIGIVWGGNPDNARGRHRSMPLAALTAPILERLDGRVALISLQHGPQTADSAGQPRLLDWEQEDLADTAALVCELDLVITVDTLMAHLAGTLGRRVWTLLPFAADWRWMTGRLDSPWYPNMRLFRQQQPGAWEQVATEVVAALAAGLG